MEYITKKCPHCGKAYSVNQPKGTGFYGSPIRMCPYCSKEFVDKDYREIAVSGVRDVDRGRLSASTLLMCIVPVTLGIGGIIYCINNYKTSTHPIIEFLISLSFIGAALFLIIDEVRGFDERQSFLKREREESEKRLKNVKYAQELKRMGYCVPGKYLKNTSENKQNNKLEGKRTLNNQNKSGDSNHRVHKSENTDAGNYQTNDNEEIKIRYCNKCGNRIPENSEFCPFCGNNLKDAKIYEKKKSITMDEYLTQWFAAKKAEQEELSDKK